MPTKLHNHTLLRRASLPGVRNVILICLLALIAGSSFSTRLLQTGSAPHVPGSDPSPLPMSFEPNEGQAASSVRFTAHAAGAALAFIDSGVAIALPSANQFPTTSLAAFHSEPNEKTGGEKTHPGAVVLRFIGANPSPGVAAGQMLPGKVNYLTGSDPHEWHTNLPTYSGISYARLYDGIELAYSGKEGLLEGTYSIAPGADPSLIRWRYQGARDVTVDSAGKLSIELAGSELTESAPVAWQDTSGQKTPVQVRYDLAPDGTVGFDVGAYDRTRPLVIDPTLDYSTYLGGYYEDGAQDVALDGAGNIYVTGYAFSPDFPVTPDSFQPVLGSPYGSDAFVTKLSHDGSAMIYSTFIGGLFDDSAQAIAVDVAGNAYITGSTNSADFPTANPQQPGCFCLPNDAFVTKLSVDGSFLVYSTYLGGQAGEFGFGIAVNSAGNAFVAGLTASPDFPLQNPLQRFRGGEDGFVTQYSQDGTVLLYSTYLGGSVGSSGNIDWVNGIAVADTGPGAGHVYVVGLTASDDFPTTTNAYQFNSQGGFDAFVSEINPAAPPQLQLVYSSYFGGQISDFGAGIAVDGAGKIYLLGDTDSTSSFPITPNAFQPENHGGYDAFVAKIDPAQSGGSSLIFSTFLGGTFSEEVENANLDPPLAGNVAVDSAGNVYVSGGTGSSDFPTVNPVQPTRSGSTDIFVSELNPDGSALVFSSYLGGTRAERGTALALDSAANIYLAGFTSSTDFPVVNAIQPQSGGGNSQDAFLARIAVSSQPPSTATPIVTPTGTPPTATPTVCVPQTNYVIHTTSGVSLVPGTFDLGLHCDDCISTLTLPFSVSVYGHSFDAANVSSNGNVQFVSMDPSPGEDVCLPQVAFNLVILPYLADLITSSNGDGVYTSISGTAPDRIYNIEWRACVYESGNPCADHVNFELRLHENSPDQQVDMVYAQVDQFGDRGVAGIQEGTGQRYKLYECFTPGGLYPGLDVRFSLPTCASPTPTGTGTPPTATHTPTPPPTRTPSPTPDGCHNPGPWMAEPSMIIERGYMASAVADNRLYTIGGTNARSGHYVDDVESFDPSSGTWTTLAPLPVPVRRAGATAIGDKIYVAGGTEGTTIQSTMQIYDIPTNTWSQGAPLPERRVGAAVAAMNGKVYVIGGSEDDLFGTTTVWEYDPLSNTYQSKAPLPSREYDIAAAVIGNRIYVVGGFDTYLHYAYDPANDSWSNIARARTPSFGAPGVFVLGGELWVVGGTFSYVRPYPPVQQVQIYSPVSDSWRFGPTLMVPRYQGPAAGAINGRGYVAGGVDATTVGGNYTFLSSMESIAYLPCGSITPAPTRSATRTPTTTPATTTATATATTTVCSPSFSDVQPSDYFYDAVRYLYCHAAISGYADGTFRPYNSATRGQTSKIIVLASGWPIYTPATPTFSDVPPGQPFYTYIETAYHQGIISGYADGTFRPANNVTRGQLTKLVVLARGWAIYTPSAPTFVDVPANHAFFIYVETAYHHNIISGYADGTFRPANNSTRGQISKIVYNAINQP